MSLEEHAFNSVISKQLKPPAPAPVLCPPAPFFFFFLLWQALQDKGVEITLNARVSSMSEHSDTNSDTDGDSTSNSTPSASLPSSYPITVQFTSQDAAGTPAESQAEADLVLWTVGTRPLVPAVQGAGGGCTQGASL